MSPNPRQLVMNLLLASREEPLSARALMAACRLFGIRENSARVTLVRLGAAGLVAQTGRGSYQLGPAASGLAADIAQWRQAEQRLCAWQGGWIAVHTGSSNRSDRVALRQRERALALLGLRELDRGLQVRPDNLVGGIDAVRARLRALNLNDDAVVFVASHFDAAHEQRARALWDSKALTAQWRTTRKKLEYWRARADTLPWDVAARESFLLGNAAIRQLVFDPLLPEPLVDVRERQACFDAVREYDRIGREIWKRWQHSALDSDTSFHRPSKTSLMTEHSS